MYMLRFKSLATAFNIIHVQYGTTDTNNVKLQLSINDNVIDNVIIIDIIQCYGQRWRALRRCIAI